MKNKPKVIVIVGPTASGKTALSIEIAKQFGGEIVSADSRQVYRGLDLGTGKVTPEEMQGVPHHLLDLADPMEVYTAADFVRDARKAIADITSRRKLPIAVGGTFFYTDALLGRISTPEVTPDPELRAQLEEMNPESLFAALEKLDERRAAEIDPHNKRRLIRALEIVKALGTVPEQAPELVYETLSVGIDIPKNELHENIHIRLIERMEKGLIDEVRELHRNGMTYERMDELGLEYRYISRHLTGELREEKMLEELETKIKQFAKRQMTWLKRDKEIHWFRSADTEKIFATIKGFLEN